jgi:hypothetical protein
VHEQHRYEHVSGEQQPADACQDAAEDQRHPAGGLKQADGDGSKLRRGHTQRGEESADPTDTHLEELLLPVHHEDAPDYDPQQRDPPRSD